MLSRKYFKDFSKGVTVKEIRDVLKEYPEDAKFTVMGDPCVYIHCESDGSTVIIDDNTLEDDYEEEDNETE